MFLKLIKHEMRASGRLMLPVICALPVVAALCGLSYQITIETESVIAIIITVLTTIAFAVGAIGLSVMAIVIMIDRFRRSMLTDEGYLTNTLPVSIHSLVCSRLVVAMIYYVLTMLALLFGLLVFGLVLAANGADGSTIADMFNDNFYFSGFAAEEINIKTILLQSLWVSAISLAATCLHFYAAMTLGHAAADHKGLLSVVYYLVLGAVLRAVVSAISVSNTLNLEEAMESMMPETIINQWYTSQMFSSAMIYLCFGAVCYVITVLMLKKKLNLA